MIVKAKVSKGGKIALPSLCKKMLNISVGDELVFDITDNQVVIFPLKLTLQKVRRLLKEKNTENESLVDKLLNERRKDAEKE